MRMSDDYVNIKIPKELLQEIEKKVKESKGVFRSAQEYIFFALIEMLKKEEESEIAYTPEEEEEEEMKKRLKKLGYF